MYIQKKEIIAKIQSFHKQLSEYYSHLYEKVKDHESKLLLKKLSNIESLRKQYLENQKEIAIVANSWLWFSCGNLDNYVENCLLDITNETDLTSDEISQIEFHFDECLIKMYRSLSNEDAPNLPGINSNLFIHLLQKTEKEEVELLEYYNN